MFKAVVFAALLALVVASPAPEPKAKPGLIAAAYSAPVVAAPLAYSAPVVSAYSAPVVSAYSAPIVSTYHGVAPAVAAYSAPLII